MNSALQYAGFSATAFVSKRGENRPLTPLLLNVIEIIAGLSSRYRNMPHLRKIFYLLNAEQAIWGEKKLEPSHLQDHKFLPKADGRRQFIVLLPQ